MALSSYVTKLATKGARNCGNTIKVAMERVVRTIIIEHEQMPWDEDGVVVRRFVDNADCDVIQCLTTT